MNFRLKSVIQNETNKHLLESGDISRLDELLKTSGFLVDSAKLMKSELIDDFKGINDKFGHEGGDFVLKHFSEILLDESRKGIDFIFRLGGEEFCIISINTPLNFASDYLKRIMETTSNKFSKTKFGAITLSIGLVEFSKDFDSCDEILSLADKKMYKAKKEGKNSLVK